MDLDLLTGSQSTSGSELSFARGMRKKEKKLTNVSICSTVATHCPESDGCDDDDDADEVWENQSAISDFDDATVNEEEQLLPSRGAILHGTGTCRPCGWFWKPGGCSNGSECNHCHACPEGEIKARKLAKAAAIQGQQLQLEKTCNQSNNAPRPPLPAPGLSESIGLPSRGSALHGSGNCRPCGWFWKPQGCSNGQECYHCHLCPEGEIKERKLAKASMMRKIKPQSHEEIYGLGVAIPADAGMERSLPVIAPPPGLATVPPLPSKGSALHGTGNCKPCGFLWKAGGCSNGRECRHCHLCHEGEIKDRKQKKMTAMRKMAQLGAEQAWPQDVVFANSMAALPMYVPLPLAPFSCGFTPSPPPPGLASPLMQETCCSWDLGSWSSCGLSSWATSTFQEREVRQGTELSDEGSTAATSTATSSNSSSDDDDENLYCQEPISRQPALQQPLRSMLSRGSALHGTGQCKPCGWFWKPLGCSNGQECNHCHACPEDEIKLRKQMKAAALRTGAL